MVAPIPQCIGLAFGVVVVVGGYWVESCSLVCFIDEARASSTTHPYPPAAKFRQVPGLGGG